MGLNDTLSFDIYLLLIKVFNPNINHQNKPVERNFNSSTVYRSSHPASLEELPESPLMARSTKRSIWTHLTKFKWRPRSTPLSTAITSSPPRRLPSASPSQLTSSKRSFNPEPTRKSDQPSCEQHNYRSVIEMVPLD